MSIIQRPPHAAASGDPIPFAIDGVTHLFSLSSPTGTLDYPERVRTSWQHISTTDFVEWAEHPVAMEPGPVGAYDGGGIWTGSVVEHDGTYYLFYTGHHVGAANPQTICLATSTDLETFTRVDGNPLVPPPAQFDAVDWRDPYVFFNEEEGCWWMLIATRAAEGPAARRGVIALATSPDLLTWTVEADPLYAPGTTFCPECPELWPLDGRWYLVYSRFSERAGTIYRVAESPRGPFRVPADETLGGRRWYAAKSAPLDARSRSAFGWVHDFTTEGGRPRWLWGGDFTSPRVITADADGALAVRLHPAVEAAMQASGSPVEHRIDAVGGAGSAAPGEALATAAALDCVFETEGDPARFGLALAEDEEGDGWWITFDRASARVRLVREPQPLDDFWADLTGRGRAYREVDGPVVAEACFDTRLTRHRLLVLLSGEVLELYVDDRVALSHRIDRTRPLRPVAFVVDGGVRARVTPLRPEAHPLIG
jgi:beta-fructofuranosidase